MIIFIIIALMFVGASQLLFIFLNADDEVISVRDEYNFNVAKMKSEEINIFALGDKFPSSKSTYKVDFRKGVII